MGTNRGERADMALTDIKLRNLKPREKAYQEADGGGLFVEVMPGGARSWRLRYRLADKQEKVNLGEYPAFTLAEARAWRDACKALAGRGVSPAALKRGDPIPADAPQAVRELAQAFLRTWCPKTVEKARAKEEATREVLTVEAFAWRWFAEVAEPNNSDPRNIRRALEKDIIPALGPRPIAEVTVADVLALTDAIKARGADQMALVTRNILKRLFGYAIAPEVATFNPAAAVVARYIATAKSRDVALTTEEVGRLLRGIYQGSIARAHKLALHLLILTMLIEARWEEFDLDKGEWSIPGERMKKDRPHLVPLPRQAVAMLEELRGLAGGSPWVFPSRNDPRKPIAKTTLNYAVRSLDLDVRDFVIHDFRRTASTHLHEAGFNSDWIEKALAHETKGIRGVYNRAQYAEQRRKMLQWWADFVDAQIEEGRKVIIGRFGKAYNAG
jgi:integrase